MSVDNSITPTSVEKDAQAERPAFGIPEDVAARYDVRVIATPDNSERRIGMFAAGDRTTPALEISGERITARKEDAETVASLIKIAQHNGWDKIEVEGSPEFQKAVWTQGTRAGLTVGGYEPNFAELERMETLRREEAQRRERETAKRREPVADAELGQPVVPAATRGHGAEQIVGAMEAVAGAVAEDNATSVTRTTPDATDRQPPAAASVDAGERLAAEDRAIVERAFERGIRALEVSGDPRALAARETATALVDQIYGDREAQAVARSTREQVREPEAEPQAVRAERQRDEGADRRRESEELAELFLHGAGEKILAEPRLSNALQAQKAMEQHIAEVFQGDASQMANATHESRQMISDVLRRGLDVSVREPTPVRQIEPIQPPPDLER